MVQRHAVLNINALRKTCLLPKTQSENLVNTCLPGSLVLDMGCNEGLLDNISSEGFFVRVFRAGR
jgi:hypothetical protein